MTVSGPGGGFGLPKSPFSDYVPGTVIMHTRQYNKLCDAGLLRVRTATGREPEIFWNGVPLIRDDNMPESGWFIVPGAVEGAAEEFLIHFGSAQPREEDDGE